MGRKRQKVVKIIKRKLPDLFLCPRCGKNTVKVNIDPKHEIARVVCGDCGLTGEFRTTDRVEPIDVYCIFIDQFYDRPQTKAVTNGAS